MKLVLLAALLVSCTAQPLGDSEQLPGAMTVGAATPSCQFALEGKSPVNLKTAGLCFALICSQLPAACHNNPTPNPPQPDAGTGGALSTGGRASTGGNAATGGVGPSRDGKALCVAATLSSPDRQREARDNGMSVDALAQSLCSYQTVQDCFAREVCK